MATKPSTTPRWSETTGGTQSNITPEPSSGDKDVGWAVDQKPPSQWFNWWMNLAYRWVTYLRDGIFVGEAGQPGLTVTGGSGAGGKGVVITAGGTNENALEATPTGTGKGVKTSSAGTGAALEATTTGAADAVKADASGGSGKALNVLGNSSAAAMTSTAAGNRSAGEFNGSGTAAAISAVHGGSGHVVAADASSGTGRALSATGNASAPAAVVTAGSGQNAAQLTGGAGAVAATLTGGSGAAGATFANGTAATGATPQNAATLTNGHLQLSGADPNSTVGFTDTLTPKNLIKAAGHVSSTGGGAYASTSAGFNIASVAAGAGPGGANTGLIVTLATGMDTGSPVTATLADPGLGPDWIPFAIFLTTTTIQLSIWDISAAAWINFSTQATEINFSASGPQ